MLAFVRTHWKLLSGFFFVVVSVGSLMPLDQLPPLAGKDKLGHLLAYGLIMFPIALRAPRYWISIACGVAVWSGVIELIQPYVNRYGEWMDLAANTGGIVIAILLALLLNKVFDMPERTD